jgi:O-antigen/teichoic acid export membrane protein
MQQAPSKLTAHGVGERQGNQRFSDIILRAGMVTLGTHVLSQLVRLFGNLILTRLLVPEAFGVMLVGNVVWVGVALFTDFGFRQSVIRSPRANDPAFVNTVWTLQVAQGLIISAVLLLAAFALHVVSTLGLVPIGNTFSNPDLPWVIAWLAVPALLASAESTKMHMAIRNLHVLRVAALEIGSQLISLTVTLAWARSTGSVSALVAGACAAAACRTVATHTVLLGERNRLRYDPAVAREVLSFGLPILLTSCIGFLILNSDKLVLGWVLPAHAMGAYAIAVLLVSAFLDAAGKLMGQVAFPAMSGAFTRDPSALRESYLHMRATADLGCLVLAGLLATCGDRIVALLYDSRYAEAGTYLNILAVSLVGIRYRLLSQAFLVIGRPRLVLYEQVSHVAALFIGIPLGFRTFGTTGAIWGVALSYVFAQVWNVLYLQRTLGLFSLKLELRGVAIFVSAVAFGAVIRMWL